MNHAEYTTVENVRQYYLSSDKTGRDATILDIIQSTSREIERICNRTFYPAITTQYYDTPVRSRAILLDDDLLELTTLTNGDGTTEASANYKAYPLNESAKNRVVMLQSASPLVASPSGDIEGAIGITGVWGYHPDYASAWQNTNAVLVSSATSTAATITVTTAKIQGGDLLKVGTEYLYASSVAQSTNDTVTVLRGVNGSTAATHNTNDVIYRWTIEDVEMVCRMAVAAYFRLKDNPVGESVQIEGSSFSTPKDVLQWMDKRLRGLGLIRIGVG